MSKSKFKDDNNLKNNNFFDDLNNNNIEKNQHSPANFDEIRDSQEKLPMDEDFANNDPQQVEDFIENKNDEFRSLNVIQKKQNSIETGNKLINHHEYENDAKLQEQVKSDPSSKKFFKQSSKINPSETQVTLSTKVKSSKNNLKNNQKSFEDEDIIQIKQKENDLILNPVKKDNSPFQSNEGSKEQETFPLQSENTQKHSTLSSKNSKITAVQVTVEKQKEKQRSPVNTNQENQHNSNPESHHILQKKHNPQDSIQIQSAKGLSANAVSSQQTSALKNNIPDQKNISTTHQKGESITGHEPFSNKKDIKKEDHDEDYPKEQLDPKFDNPLEPFSISRNQLIRLASAAQQRHFSEEVDFLESIGGVDALFEGLKTDTKRGLDNTDEDFECRNKAFGNNLQEISIPKGFIELFCDALEDFTMRILLVAAVISIIIEVATASNEKRSRAWIEGFAILVAVFVCATVTSVNDYQKERQFQELNSEADKRKIVTIIRNGQKENKHQSLVMVGDIIQLVEGMEIPADGVIIEASELTSDESAMTGETDPMKKNTLQDCIKKRNEIITSGGKNSASNHDVPSPLLLSGTKVLTGSGKMMIIVVGEFSCVGKISKLLNSKEEEVTPLQEKLESIAMDIGGLGLKSSVLIVFVLFIRFAIEKISQNEWDNSHDWAEMLDFFIIGVTVVVVAIPEGLPLSVTLSLAYSVKKMLKDNNLVRKLQACETMGGADCICSDKTGTLTQNKMTLTTWWNEEIQEFNKYGSKDELENYIDNKQSYFQKLFLQSCAINCSADLYPDEKGSKTEVAVLKLIEKFDVKYEVWREKYPPELTFPFSSARKRMSIVINSDGKRVLLVKGASEMVLASCNQLLSKKTGQIRKIDDATRNQMTSAIKSMADNALRTIVLGYKELNSNEDMESKDKLGVFDVETKDLICLAIFGIKDILREEVPDAVKQCQDAGIKVRMVTGDNKDTARAIARDCNILFNSQSPSPYQVIEGIEFIKLTGGIVCKKCQTSECGCVRDSETAQKEGKSLRVDTIKNGSVFDKIYKEIDVMARSRPEDKYAMVVGLIERGHVVAVTGDGTNDAPALKKADVGFAMGIAGTEVARGAAAIILLDDNFKSIVSAVLWGRNIYDSIKKFLQFQLTVNIVAVGITLIGAAILKQEVLQAIQMLWINLIMDTFASLALATEPPMPELLLRKPHDRSEYIVSKKMFKHIIGQALYQLAILILIVFKGEDFLPEVADSFDDEIKDNTLFDKWWKAKYSNEEKTLVCSGRLKSYSGTTKEYQLVFNKYNQPSRHFTTVFNVFVWMQIFNFLNARKLKDELNIFEGISRNPLFFIIVFIIAGLQALLIQVGNVPFYCYKLGLNGGNWGISIGFGAGSLVWGFCLKFISEEKCREFGSKRVNPINNSSRILSLKGNRDDASMSRRYSVLMQHPIPKNHS